MTSALLILGGGFQFIGLAFVFAEIAAIRAHEWGIVPPWTRAVRWAQQQRAQLRAQWNRLRQRLRRRRDASITAASASIRARAGSSSSASDTVRVRVGPPAEDATDAERIAWLVSMVRMLDDNIEQVRNAVSDARAQSHAEVASHDHLRRVESRSQVDLHLGDDCDDQLTSANIKSGRRSQRRCIDVLVSHRVGTFARYAPSGGGTSPSQMPTGGDAVLGRL